MSEPMVKLSIATKKRLLDSRRILLTWFRKNGRDYDWRKPGMRPYQILVREFMLQQTSPKQIEDKLPQFLKLFPTANKLAQAPTAKVLRAWQGLGYNRRALNLQRSAEAIAHRGRKPFPNTLEELRALRGVGEYTASAVLAFAFNADVSVVDVNIERVLSRIWKRMPNMAANEPIQDIRALDAHILPLGRSAEWHQAIMDFGATICTKRKPGCIACPLIKTCKSGKHFIKTGGEPTNAKPKERKYFGHPRRIWRGRILKGVADAESIAEPRLIGMLAGGDPIEFRKFVRAVLESLKEEGFIVEIKPRVYSLTTR
jgi:A/G-specific adenine glycosylase